MEQARIFLTAAGVLLAAVMIPFGARSASAAGDSFWTTWKLDVSGDSGQIVALLYITVGNYDKNGNPVELHTEPIQLACQAVKSAGVSGDTLIFKGGYFECEFPNLLETAERIILEQFGKQHKFNEPPEGLCACDPVGLAYVQADAVFQKDAQHPVFAHPSISFRVNRQSGAASNHFTFAGHSTVSDSVNASQGLFESRYDWNQNKGEAFWRHFLNNNQIGSDQKAPSNLAKLYTKPVVVTIGGSQAGGMIGSMTRLVVDPGCRVD
ncbi:MAG: hypothetical protein H6642_09125 [Caldilineaceae bacterium]|nr:hypothetical protein [Caldilineaceae bacterium]